ncbi:MAG TPA: ABC transporter permease [Longimicrobium sp.]|jgi:predicted permease
MPADRPYRAGRRHLLVTGRDVDAEVDEELRFHLEMRAAEYAAAGAPPEQARGRALSRFGDLERVRRACLAIGRRVEKLERRRRWLDDLAQDLRYAARQFLRSPAFTATAVLSLAAGIGANAAVFGVVHAVVLRPPPYPAPERLVRVHETWRGSDGKVAPGLFADLRRGTRSFAALAAYDGAGFNLAGGAGAERVPGARVSAEYFRVPGLPPLAGRYFLPDEERPGRGRVAVLGEALWRRRFGGDPRVVGSAVRLNGEPHTVVGVAPAEASLGPATPAQLWVPLTVDAAFLGEYDGHSLTVVGRLREGASPEWARAELAAVARAAAARHPADLAERGVRAGALGEELVRDVRPKLLVLWGAAAAVLLLVCANVAGLLLARSAARRHEIAVRAALGAGTGRMVRQLLAEGMLLAAAGGAAALAVAWAGVRLLVRLAPDGLPFLERAGLDARVLAYAAGLTLAAGALCGLIPAAAAARLDVEGALRSAGSGRGRRTAAGTGRALAAAQVAAALVLLAATGLLARSGIALARVEPGFEPRGVLAMSLTLPRDARRAPERAAATFSAAVERVRALPGVEAAGAVSDLPLGGASTDVGLRVEGRPMPAGTPPSAHLRLVTPGYFTAMRIPLLRGRAPAAGDGPGSPPVVLVNRALAKKLWPGEDPLGKRVSCCAKPDRPAWREVVGVVGDVRHFGLAAEPAPELYVPHAQAPAGAWVWLDATMTLVARSPSAPGALADEARAAVGGLGPDLPLFQVRTMEEVVAASTAAVRFTTLLFAAFAALGVALAAFGVYGVLALSVAQRTHEFGVRLALGAHPARVRALVVRQGAALALVGIGAGGLAAPALTGPLRPLLYHVAPVDAPTYAAVAALLLGVAVLASYLPARRATRVDPAVTLRSD